MKLLMVGADAVCPDYIFNYKEHYPHLAKLIDSGVSAGYSAYVQKGYNGSYQSEMNWASIHTGQAPWEHGIQLTYDENGVSIMPEMKKHIGHDPLWTVLNDNHYKCALWQVPCCLSPMDINGYVVSSQYEMLETPRDNRFSDRTIQVSEKDRWILELLPGTPPPRRYPKTLHQQGYDFNELKVDANKAEEAVKNYHFQDSIQNFREELDYYYTAMIRAQEKNPVDFMYFYTPTTDLIGHCSMYCDQSEVLVQAYQILDEYVGKWIDSLQPDNVIVLSDHGMVNFKELVYSRDADITKEAFYARDDVLWLDNGYIAFEAHNGALLFTAHGLKGMFIAAGKDIVAGKQLHDMRTLDIYPTVLELFGVSVPQKRNGFVVDCFNRPIVNQERLWKSEDHTCKQIAVLQTMAPNITDIVVNEIYLHNRFAQITLVGEKRYHEIFEHNPRIAKFVSFEEFDESQFDEVYCGVYDEASGLFTHIKIRG